MLSGKYYTYFALQIKVKTKSITGFLLLVSFVAGGSALKCYVYTGEGNELGREDTAKDPSGNDAAHGLCIHMRSEDGDVKVNVKGWIGWNEEHNEAVRKCLSNAGFVAGKCIGKEFSIIDCLAGSGTQLQSYSNTTLKTLVTAPKYTSCFCDKDLCNDNLVDRDEGDDGNDGGDDNNGAPGMNVFVSTILFGVLFAFKMN